MIIAIDFDGTCVEHDYPAMGASIGAEPVLKKLVEQGHQLILWTMRSGPELAYAVDWFKEAGIPLWGINENPKQHTWTTSRKAYANLYIDDAAACVPLVYANERRPYVDWDKLEVWLKQTGVLK